MDEVFAVIFRDGLREAAGSLDVGQDRLRLHGRSSNGDLEVELPFSDVSEVRIGRRPGERLNGFRTLVLERDNLPAIYVAPLGMVSLHEIADLLNSLGDSAEEDVLAISVPLKPGCRGRARKLLADGPPIDPASIGISSHDVYLADDDAVFVFRGSNVRAQVTEAFRHPAVWRAGIAWQRCFAGPPQTIDPNDLDPHAAAAYRWEAHRAGGRLPPTTDHPPTSPEPVPDP